LGVKLFRRLPKSLRLTDEGQALLPELREAFERMARAINRVTSAQSASALSVSTLTTFALTWLVSRLPRFQARHPDIEVRLNTTGRLVDFAREDVDVAVRYGDGNWRGLTIEKMFEDELTPLCGRAYKDRLRAPEHLRDVPLLDASPPEPASVGEWGAWFKAAGIGHLPMTRGAVFDSTKIAAQAAIDGLGVAIGSPYLFAEDIAAGRLFQPFPLTVRNGRSYWLVCAEGTATRPKIKAFRDWVFSELG
jgi:DNA-binding transcriptional LysR family regulator